jgi:hypothetical protein
MAPSRLLILSVTAFVTAFSLTPAARASPPVKPISFNTAMGELEMQVEHDHLYPWAKRGCLGYMDDGEDEQYENISIHEVHDKRCPGDPETYPRVDSFRINRLTRQIEWMSLDGDYQLYSHLKHRKSK